MKLLIFDHFEGAKLAISSNSAYKVDVHFNPIFPWIYSVFSIKEGYGSVYTAIQVETLSCGEEGNLVDRAQGLCH